ncbi:MAG: phasin family protein [Candidatus Accumulibacter phosphatis]|jgi:phasin family protein|uniref:Phasin family protein n=1 Tax=Candidatus Accumulibacter contiguus TaxID=2954381 RepID=A0ABX1TA32_9PROT|nr:phasin family protein [Candidatus Accumulibacter contiguus]NMQ05871.1 phasin family protein [Candidatus Accumulibacter contiguus]
MYNPIEKFTSVAGLEALRTVVNTSLDCVGQLAALNLQTARAVAERTSENLRALTAVRDLPDLLALRQPMAMAAVDQSMSYSRRAYEICSESSNALLQVFDSQVNGLSGGLMAALDKGWKTVSPVFDSTLATAKSLLSMTGQNDGHNVRQLTASPDAAGQAAIKRIAA